MSYRCGIYEPLASVMGVEPGPPRITCDGCGIKHVLRENKLPPKWFLDGKAPPGWRMDKQREVRRDYCRTCKDNNP